MIHWLDLLIEGDSHPRRFDGPASLRPYLLRVERLSEEAADELMESGHVAPPLARREYSLRPLAMAALE
ncbi:hypothetical protein [Deinococcus arenicola]|uniref:Uncharacterized protein n=1 Tax=Deinococcus arenicola TaxID=2994950 RepID=A0ABU4DS96_9DEIO|nr:hypothetical protein [Deinococcus sp. ZS9-10]MDV6375301.1 hypothetical protein [Deinococcus sp. ZS9-10]